LRITFLCPHLRIAGGVRAILTHADRLAARGHVVTLVVPERRRFGAWWRARFGRGVGLRAAGGGAARDSDPSGGEPAWMPGLRARVMRVTDWDASRLPDGDAIVATSWQSATPVARAPARCGAKLYFVQHYESLYHGEAARVDATYRLPLRKIVISTWLAEIMAERFDSPAALIVTPVDPALFHPVPDARDGVLRALMLHHDYAWKGVADGVEAARRVKQGHPALRLVGFGVRPPATAVPYDEFFADLGQERLAWLYSRCPIYLCPSWDEGLGMPPMEAMACGAALCTYDNGGCRDYAIEGKTAVVAARRDVDGLARGLEQLVVDEALRSRLAADGQAFITSRFGWEEATARFETVLRESA